MNAGAKKAIKITLIVVALIVTATVAFGFWYQQRYSITKAKARTVNDSALPAKVLIATQGSRFKDHVTAGIIEKLGEKPVYVSVIDVGDLAGVNADDWTVVVIIHTWEMGKPPKPVTAFLAKGNHENVITLATSGDGRSHIEGIDGITSASKISDADRCVREIIKKIEDKLGNETL